MDKITRAAAAAIIASAGLGLAGLGGATIAQAQPMLPMDYNWCPGQAWDPLWGMNWDQNVCHDDHFRNGEPRDQAHWHGDGNYDPGWGQGGQPGWQQGGQPGWQPGWQQGGQPGWGR